MSVLFNVIYSSLVKYYSKTFYSCRYHCGSMCECALFKTPSTTHVHTQPNSSSPQDGWGFYIDIENIPDDYPDNLEKMREKYKKRFCYDEFYFE
jgi:hypothetical protein